MYQQRLSTKEVARILGISLNRVRYALLMDHLSPTRDDFGNFSWSEDDIRKARQHFGLEAESSGEFDRETSDEKA